MVPSRLLKWKSKCTWLIENFVKEREDNEYGTIVQEAKVSDSWYLYTIACQKLY